MRCDAQIWCLIVAPGLIDYPQDSTLAVPAATVMGLVGWEHD
jgi:hypothetical protein